MSNELLGLGYTGYGQIAGKYLLFIASDLSETNNWITSQGTLTTSPRGAVGDRPARGRTVLEGTLTSYLTPNTCLLVRELGWAWRISAVGQSLTSMTVKAANGHGYTSQKVYVERISVNVQSGQLATISFHIKCFNYSRVEVAQNSRYHREFDTFDKSVNQVIPYYDCTLNIPGQPGTVLAYTLDINHNYVYKFLAEVTTGPPPPGAISAGILEMVTTVTTIAEVGGGPGDTTSLDFKWGGRVKVPNATVPFFSFLIPQAFADNPIKMNGFGSQKDLIAWSVGWRATQAPAF